MFKEAILLLKGRGPAAVPSKAIIEARLKERKFALFRMLATGRWAGKTAVQRPTPTADNQWTTAFIDTVGRGGYMQKQHSQLTVMFTSVIGGSDQRHLGYFRYG